MDPVLQQLCAALQGARSNNPIELKQATEFLLKARVDTRCHAFYATQLRRSVFCVFVKFFFRCFCRLDSNPPISLIDQF